MTRYFPKHLKNYSAACSARLWVVQLFLLRVLNSLIALDPLIIDLKFQAGWAGINITVSLHSLLTLLDKEIHVVFTNYPFLFLSISPLFPLRALHPPPHSLFFFSTAFLLSTFSHFFFYSPRYPPRHILFRRWKRHTKSKRLLASQQTKATPKDGIFNCN